VNRPPIEDTLTTRPDGAELGLDLLHGGSHRRVVGDVECEGAAASGGEVLEGLGARWAVEQTA
jgi:hypothetical protein